MLKLWLYAYETKARNQGNAVAYYHNNIIILYIFKVHLLLKWSYYYK